MRDNEQHTFQSLFIKMKFEDTEISSGTAFIVRRNERPFIVTNKHNATGRDADGKCLSSTGAVPNYLDVYFRSKENVYETIIKTIPLLEDEKALFYEHPLQNEFIDVVCLPIDDFKDVEYFCVNISENRDIEKSEADTVSIIGFPFGIHSEHDAAIWSTGFIASNPAYKFDNQDKFLVDCRSRQGQSGSPVFSYGHLGTAQRRDGHNTFFAEPRARFMGIYSGRICKESDLGYVWKPNIIEEIIDEYFRNN